MTAETPDLRGPATVAGRRLLAELQESPLPGARYAYTVVNRDILAIEREAAAAAEARVAVNRR